MEMTVAEICKKYGLVETTIRAALKKAAVRRIENGEERAPWAFDEKQAAAAIRDYYLSKGREYQKKAEENRRIAANTVLIYNGEKQATGPQYTQRGKRERHHKQFWDWAEEETKAEK